MFNQVFFLPQVKQSIVISNKHGIYELPHVLPNNLRLRILGNQEIPRKPQPSAWSSFQTENFVNTSKKLLRNRK